MPIRQFKPTSAGRRWFEVPDFSGLEKKGPEKSLTEPRGVMSGRNNQGRITIRFRGGGHKKRYRVIDF